MVGKVGIAALALLLTVGSVRLTSFSGERAMYGWEGPVEHRWLPRELGGWPAPFLADSPDTSVLHRIGVEDDFRPGAFVASYSFWLVVTLGLLRLIRKVTTRR